MTYPEKLPFKARTAVIGTSNTLSENYRFHRGATGLQVVAADDSTAEGVDSGGQSQINIGAAAGEPSFKLGGVSSNIATIKGGYIFLDNGKEIATDQASAYGVDMTFNLKTEVNQAGITAPAINTRYYLYLDTGLLGAPVNTGANDRRIYPATKGVNGPWVVRSESPENVNLERLIPISVLKTDGSGDYAGEDLARRRHSRLSAQINIVESKVDKTITTAVAETILAHGLNQAPNLVKVFFYDSSASSKVPLNEGSLVTFIDSTNLKVNSAGVTFDSGDYLEVVMAFVEEVGSTLAISTRRYESPWITSDSVTQFAHGLDIEDIKSISVIEYNTSTGERRILETSTPVTFFDATNINLDWGGFDFTNKQYKLVTGSSSMPNAYPALGDQFEFTGTGQLLDATFPCTKLVGTYPESITAVQKTAEGWAPVDVTGLVYVTDDVNHYLQGNIDSLAPAAGNPVRITVR